MTSPYERALGDRIAELHPKTAWYFRTIPPGRVGTGRGVFTRAGSRRRWLRPVFRVTEALGVAFAGWERDVPFRIENRTVDGSAVAVRRFDLPGRSWVMSDSVSWVAGRGILRNEIGPRRTVVGTFDIEVRDAAVRLTGRRVGMRVGVRVGKRWVGLRVAIPRFASPRIGLVERWDDERARHHVNLTIDVPLVGRIYEYTGYFEYTIESETP